MGQRTSNLCNSLCSLRSSSTSSRSLPRNEWPLSKGGRCTHLFHSSDVGRRVRVLFSRHIAELGKKGFPHLSSVASWPVSGHMHALRVVRFRSWAASPGLPNGRHFVPAIDTTITATYIRRLRLWMVSRATTSWWDEYCGCCRT